MVTGKHLFQSKKRLVKKPGRITLVGLRDTREDWGGGERRRAVKILNEKHGESAQGPGQV
jgi:hypothetical protein